MTVDLLSVRLKEAKRELTNLKTAHLRGLGLLKIYKKTYVLNDFGIQDSTYNRVRMTINFDYNFPPYTLVQLLTQIAGTSGFDMSLTVDSMNYTNSGYTLNCECILIREDSQGLTSFFIVSTAPVRNLTIEDV